MRLQRIARRPEPLDRAGRWALPGAAELIRRAHDEAWRIVLASSSRQSACEHYLKLSTPRAARSRHDQRRRRPGRSTTPTSSPSPSRWPGRRARCSWGTPPTTSTQRRAQASAVSACSRAVTARPSCTRPAPRRLPDARAPRAAAGRPRAARPGSRARLARARHEAGPSGLVAHRAGDVPTLTRPTSPMSTAAKAWLTNG